MFRAKHFRQNYGGKLQLWVRITGRKSFYLKKTRSKSFILHLPLNLWYRYVERRSFLLQLDRGLHMYFAPNICKQCGSDAYTWYVYALRSDSPGKRELRTIIETIRRRLRRIRYDEVFFSIQGAFLVQLRRRGSESCSRHCGNDFSIRFGCTGATGLLL